MTAQREVARTFTIAELREHVARLRSMRGLLRQAYRDDTIGQRLREQIRYGVAITNQCRHCQVAHETFALHAGTTADELASVVGGDPAAFEPAAWTAILYAQALAAADFAPNSALRTESERFWTPAQCDEIEALALEMTVANRCGNTFDALLRRLRGRADSRSLLRDELAVSMVFLAGAMLSIGRIAMIRRESPLHYIAMLCSEPGAPR
jgi:AhpD family alkylhydroperoxidase